MNVYYNKNIIEKWINGKTILWTNEKEVSVYMLYIGECNNNSDEFFNAMILFLPKDQYHPYSRYKILHLRKEYFTKFI